MTIKTHSTVSETTRDRLVSAIGEYREEHGSVPAIVATLRLTNEDVDADHLSLAMVAVAARTPVDGSGLPSLYFALDEAFHEATREPARGGGQS